MKPDDEETMANGEFHDTVPIRRSTLDDILEAVHECRTAIAALRVEVADYKDRINSDIRALREGDKRHEHSIADITATELAEAKATNAEWRRTIVTVILGVAGALSLMVLTWLVARAGLK
jgi:predicted transcriptional regulator